MINKLKQIRNNSYLFSNKLTYVILSFFILGVIFLSFLTLWNMRNEALEHAYLNTQNLTKSIDQTIESMIDSVDYALQISADEIDHQTFF